MSNQVKQIIRQTVSEMLADSMSAQNIHRMAEKIMRGSQLFDRFLHIRYADVDEIPGRDWRRPRNSCHFR